MSFNEKQGFLTLREKLEALLRSSDHPLTVEELSQLLALPPSESKLLYEHLRHLAKSIWQKSKGREALVMVPPTCRNCGYIFKELDKPRRPSKCPKCRSQRITPPAFKIART